MRKRIIEKLDTAIRNMDNDNFEELFPIILDDLTYILIDLKKDEDKLTIVEQFEYGTTFNEKTTSYMAKLAKLYFKLIFGLDINIVNSKEYALATAGGGYSSEDGNIYYSDFGVMLSHQSDLSFLHTCLHEGRHKMQHNFYETSEILSFPPNMLKLLKESLLENSLQDNNREFYRNNYDILLTENDAEIFAKREIYNFIKKLAQMYIKLYNTTPKEMNDLLIKISEINNLFINILKKESFNINNEIIFQISDSNLMNYEYEILGQRIDALIVMDKYIKAHPELKEQYPILKLLFNDRGPKSYEEIMIDKSNFTKNKTLEEQQKIESLYNEIIILDPILTITDKLEKGDKQGVKEYLDLHPTLLSEYTDEIRLLNEKYNFYNAVFSDFPSKR